MTRLLLAQLALLGLAAAASGQGPYGQGYYSGNGGQNPYAPAAVGSIPAAGAMPNFYNRQYQPLSPYLNLLRGGNPGVNYYYGVRPGQIANGQYPGGAQFGGAGRQGYAGGFPAALNFVPPGEQVPVAPPNSNVAFIPPIGQASFGPGLQRFGSGFGQQGGALRGVPQNLGPAQPARPAAPKR